MLRFTLPHTPTDGVLHPDLEYEGHAAALTAVAAAPLQVGTVPAHSHVRDDCA